LSANWCCEKAQNNRCEKTISEVLRRAPDLEVHEVPDGYIIYHSVRDNVSYLNKTAAIVFELCDGARDADDIIARVAKIFDLGVSANDEIRACIDSLAKEGLIQSSAT
jgi:hypothetical protein